MRHLILVAVIVQLVITVDINGLRFGDIIVFPPRSLHGFKYSHYAIYVGNETFPRKKAGDDIFERRKHPPGCFFSKLSKSDNPKKCNYLDGYTDWMGKRYNAGTDEQIRNRIINTPEDCGYKLCTNNCEHLVTHVRYGVKVAMQLNNTGVCINEVFIDVFHLKRFLKKQGGNNGVCISDPLPGSKCHSCSLRS